jgi:uncharacterized membrane protein HdeD (DUF308 family)
MTMPLLDTRLREIWPVLYAEGVAMIVLGGVAIVLPAIGGLVVAILFGWLLVVSGLVGLLVTLSHRHRPGFWWALLSDLLAMVIGTMLYAWPAGGLVSMSAALGGFLALDGILALLLAREHRHSHMAKWSWLAANGVLDLVFAGVILVWLPQAQFWALGVLIGADMMFGGATLVAMALDERGARAQVLPS